LAFPSTRRTILWPRHSSMGRFSCKQQTSRNLPCVLALIVYRRFSYDAEESKNVLSLSHHEESCRSVIFAPDGACKFMRTEHLVFRPKSPIYLSRCRHLFGVC
jgi:hypothetical protein